MAHIPPLLWFRIQLLIWDVYGKTMEKMDWIIITTNANNKTDNLEGCMDKDGHNSHTNYEIEHQILALDFNDYIFSGYFQ